MLSVINHIITANVVKHIIYNIAQLYAENHNM